MKEYHELFADKRTRVPGTEKARAAHIEVHHAYLTRLREEGKVLMAGPFKDGSGGLVLFSVSSQEEAMVLSSNDPFVVHGVHKSHVKPWSIRVC